MDSYRPEGLRQLGKQAITNMIKRKQFGCFLQQTNN